MAQLKILVSSKDHIQGNQEAPITLVEYGDYECPICGMAYPLVKLLQKHFGDKLRFVFRNFPLTEIHPHSEMAAETAESADTHGRFWEMHDLLFENQKKFSPSFFVELVESLNLSGTQFLEAVRDNIYKSKIRQDFLGGVKSGVNGTPTFFINDLRYDGSIKITEMVSTIDSILISKR